MSIALGRDKGVEVDCLLSISMALGGEGRMNLCPSTSTSLELGGEMVSEPCSLLFKFFASSCRSFATPPAGATSFSSIASPAMDEGESIISVSRSINLGGDAWFVVIAMLLFNSLGILPGDHCISGGAEEGPGVMSPAAEGCAC